MTGPKKVPHQSAEERVETTGSKASGLSRQEKDAALSSGGGRQAEEVVSKEGPHRVPHVKAKQRIETTGSKASGLSRQEKDAAFSAGGGRQAQELQVDESELEDTGR